MKGRFYLLIALLGFDFLGPRSAFSSQVMVGFHIYQSHRTRPYDAVVFLPECLRKEFGTWDRLDILLSRIYTDPSLRQPDLREQFLLYFKKWITQGYREEGLINDVQEPAMVERMLNGSDENSALVLILDNFKILGSLRFIFSTDAAPLPAELTILNARKVIPEIKPSSIEFATASQALHAFTRGERPLSILEWGTESAWFVGGTATTANLRIDQTSTDEEVELLLFVVSAMLKLFDRGGQSVPTNHPYFIEHRERLIPAIRNLLSTADQTGYDNFGRSGIALRWPNGVPDEIRPCHLGVRNSRFFLTCSAEPVKLRGKKNSRPFLFPRLYQARGYEKYGEPFSDIDRNGRRSQVMVATRESLLNREEPRVLGRYEREDTRIDLRWTPLWPFPDHAIPCAKLLMRFPSNVDTYVERSLTVPRHSMTEQK